MHERADTTIRRACDRALAAAFAAGIALVPILTFARPAGPASIEREFRRPSPLPDAPRTLAQWLDWPAAYEAWYRDHFGLRPALIRWHNIVELEFFGVSPTSEIVAGPGRWLYTTRHRAVEVFRGADPFSERELQLWTTILEDRRAWCAERGVAYVFAIAPNKETIYPERFPARFDKVGPTRREQLVEHLRRHSDFPLVDLTAALLEAKRAFAPDPVYFPLGTHWNDLGVVHAYRALIERVGALVPGVAPLPLEAFRFEPTDYQDDSWAGRLYMEDLLRQANWEADFERHFPRSYWEAGGALKRIECTTERADGELPRAVVFHDSMGEKLRPLLAEHFARTTFRWVSNFDTELIESERPGVVIQVFVERALAAFSLSTSPLDTQERLAREFEASSVVLHTGFGGIERARDLPIELTRAADGSLRATLPGDGGGAFALPALDVPPDTWPVLRIELDAPRDTALLVEFLTERFPDYSRIARGVRRRVSSGPNVIYVKLRVPDLVGRLRVHPGLAAGEYLLRSLEVRAVQ